MHITANIWVKIIPNKTYKNKEQVINEIVKAAQKCDEVLLAPDPDREGEIIAWHIGEEIAKVMDRSKIRRITFNEITKEAILDSIQHTSDINMQRVAAQQARRVLDRWVGYEVSPILWRKITRGLSAGRVQSVALKLVCDRESAIRAFKPEEFWSIIGQFAHQKEKFEEIFFSRFFYKTHNRDFFGGQSIFFEFLSYCFSVKNNRHIL